MGSNEFLVKVGYLFDEASLKANATKSTNIFGNVLRDFRSQLALQVGRSLARSAMQGIEDMVQNVMELDKAQTELKKVSDLTGKSLDAFTEKAYRVGESVAKTGTQIVQAATEFQKSGYGQYGSDAVLSLAEVASKYQNIADAEISAGDAANFIVSQLKAYGMEWGEAEHVIDAVNKVSNEFAVSSVDIATNIGKTSAAMAQGNVSYEETIGLMTAMTEITRSGTKAARGLVTIQSRLNQTTDESSSTGKKLTAWYKEHNIAIMEDENTMRSFYDIAGDVAKQWDTLSDTEKRYYLNIQAGANQTQNLAALLRNYGVAIEATEAATNSANSANEENAKYLDSIEGRLANLQSAWEQLSYHVINSDLVKNGISFLTNIVKGADSLVEHIGSLPAAITAIVVASKGLSALNILTTIPDLISGAGGLKTLSGTGIKDFLALLKTGNQSKGAVANNGKLATSVQNLIKRYELLKIASLNITKSTEHSSEEIKKAREALGGLSRKQYVRELEQTGGALENLSKSSANVAKETADMPKSLTKLIKILPTLSAATVVLGVAIASIAIDNYFSFDKSIERLHDYEDQLKTVQSEIAGLEAKRDAGDITDQESIHLSVLQAEEASLRAQIELEKGRAKIAFKKDASSRQGKKYQERTGPKEVLEYQDATKKATDAYTQLNEAIARRDELQKKSLDNKGNFSKEDLWALNELNKRIPEYEQSWLEAYSAQKNAGAEAASYYENLLSLGLDVNTMTQQEKEAYNGLHEAFLTNQIDVNNISDSYDEMFDAISRGFEDFGGLEGIIDFDKIDISKLKTVDDLVGAISKQFKELPEDEIISIEAKDETGEVIGNIKTEKGDLTDKQWNLIINAQTTGDWSKVEEYANKNPKEDKFIKITQSITQKWASGKAEEKNAGVDDKASTIVEYNPDDSAIKRKNLFIKNNPISQKVDYTVGSVEKPKFAGGKSKGKQGGMAWLGDEGSSNNPKPELVVGEHGAYLAGTQGWEQYPVKSSDTVYTYAQTKKLLGGSQKFASASEIPRYAKGTKKKKQTAFDKALATLEYKRDKYHWTDSEFQKKYNSLYKKYKKYLSTEQKRSYGRSLADVRHDVAKSDIDALIDVVAESGDVKSAINSIKKARDAKKISSDEYKEMRKEAYKNALEYTAKETEAGRKSYADLLKVAKDYWKEVGKNSKEYYDSLDKLREASQKQLESKQERYEDEMDYTKQYIQLQIDSLERQKDANKAQREAVDNAQELVDLQNDLAKARATTVRVYHEGIGWVYEQDVTAVRDAQKALDDFNAEHATDEIDNLIDKYEQVLDLFDVYKEEADFIALGQKLGVSGIGDIIKGSILDVDYMSNWVKGSYTWINALDDLITQLDDMSAQMYETYVATGITQSMLDNKYQQYGYDASNIYKHLNYYNGSNSSLLSNSILDTPKYTPNAISGVGSNAITTQNFNFNELVLPNVSNANEFYTELQKLPNMAIQISAQR